MKVRLERILRRRWIKLLSICLLALSGLTRIPAPARAQDRPYVVLVSLDGFRYDYAERYKASHILAIRDNGAAASSLIPSFPSVTFPNHLSIITGLYPEHHGIVANTFYDPARQTQYTMARPTSSDGSWYRGTPLWVLAERQGMKAATMFWPGSDAEIGGVRPSYWFPFDGTVPDEDRVQRVLNWLRLPADQRPHFLTLYISDTDGAGHRFGPEAAETRQAVERVDRIIGRLWEGIQSVALPINLIVVSDHGMQSVDRGRVDLSQYADLTKARVVSNGAFALIYASDPATGEKIYLALKGKSPMFDVYRRSETPPQWHYADSPRIGDLVVIARQACILVGSVVNSPDGKAPRELPKGEHGYDPRQFMTMHGIFYAIGPNIIPKSRVDAFENVNIYPFLAKILGLKLPAELDGSPAVLESLYRP